MNYVLSLLLGYGLGCLNPAALLSKVKKQDLRNQGTKNLGAATPCWSWAKNGARW